VTSDRLIVQGILPVLIVSNNSVPTASLRRHMRLLWRFINEPYLYPW